MHLGVRAEKDASLIAKPGSEEEFVERWSKTHSHDPRSKAGF